MFPACEAQWLSRRAPTLPAAATSSADSERCSVQTPSAEEPAERKGNQSAVIILCTCFALRSTESATASEGRLGSTSYLQAGHGEVSNESDDLGIVLHLHQLSQLVIAFQSGQQSAELVVVVWV